MQKATIIVFIMGIVLSLLFGVNVSWAQTGPGGIGTDDGASTLEFWLQGNFGVEEAASDPAEVGDPVSAWLDQSGNGNNMTQDFGAAPIYRISSGLASVDFEGISGYLRGSSVITGTTARTFFTVMQPSALSAGNSNNAAWGLSPNTNSNGEGYGLFVEQPSSNSGLGLRVNGRKLMDYTANGFTDADLINNPFIYTGQSGTSADVLSTAFHLNGTLLTVDNNPGTATLNTNNAGVIIGGFSTGGDNVPETDFDFNGNIFEIIVFSKQLNDAQRIIMENYLGSKYDRTVANDRYSFDDRSASGIYFNEVAGIGQANDGSQHLSANSSIINIKNASANANELYLMLGHDGADGTAFTNNETPDGGTNSSRIAREWRVDETNGDIGTVELTVDFSSLGGVTPGFTPAILLDSDGDFSSGATVVDLDPTTFNVTNLNLSDGIYITVAEVRRTLNFSTANAQEFENASDAFPTIQAELNFPFAPSSGTNVDFSFSVTGDGTITIGSDPAQSGDDITNDVTTGTITAGNTAQDINIFTSAPAVLELIDDGDVENTETVDFQISSISNPGSGITIGSTDVLSFDVLDDDDPRKISFSNTSRSETENDGTNFADINIQLTLPSGQTSAGSSPFTSVQVTATGTADVNSDFQLLEAATPSTDTSYREEFPANSQTSNIQLRIQGDDLSELDETVILTLSDPASGALATNNTQHTLTIVDNDAQPTVAFNLPSSSSDESVSPANIEVRLSTTSGQTVDVPFSLNSANSTATGGGTDFTITTTSPISFSPGEISKNIAISIVDDAEEENNESIQLDLGSPTGATLGSPSSHDYIIQNNDQFGSTGPGGVGFSDGTSTLELWLDPEQGVENASGNPASDGESVEFWRDQSGNAKDMQHNTGSQPIFQNTSPDLPRLDFSASTTYLRGSSVITGTTARTFFTVIQPTALSASNSNNAAWGLSPNTNTDGEGYGLFVEQPSTDTGLGLRVQGRKLMDYTADGFTDSDLTTTPFMYSGQSGTPADVLTTDFYFNGTLLTVDNNPGSATLDTDNSGVIIGGFSSDGDNIPESQFDFNGDIFELIVYSTDLNTTRRIILENYLSAKYAIPTNNDFYSGDDPAQNDYDMDVQGIGTVDGNEVHFRAENSAGLELEMSGNSFDAANEYLFSGHRVETNKVTTADVPSGVEQRWERVWFIDKTGNVDGRIVFDFVEAGVGAVAQNTNYVVLFSSTNAFSFSNLGVTPTSVTSSEVTFDLTNSQIQDGYYTIGTTDATASPLPIELQSFNIAEVNNGKDVILKWTTATEKENFGFYIFRSFLGGENDDNNNAKSTNNDTTWTEIGFVEGAGTTKRPQNYTYQDNELQESGKYLYKLRQVDFDGVSEEFGPVSFLFNVPNKFKLNRNYPNPFNPSTNITYSVSQTSKVSLKVYNVLGREVATLVNKRQQPGRYSVEFDAGNLSSGLYFVRMQADGNVFTQKMTLVK